VAVNLDAVIWEIYYEVYCHLFGISKYFDKLNDEDSGEKRVYTLFYKSFTRKDKSIPFWLELIHPSKIKWCDIGRSSRESCLLDIRLSSTLKKIIESNNGEIPDFKLVYSDEDEFSFSKLNLKTKEPLNLYVPNAKPQRSEPLSVYELMDDFCSVNYLDAESQAK
jgi:hypothetical protein